MKGILEFNLPEDEENFKDAQNGSDWKFMSMDFDNFLRGKLKYEELSEEASNIYEEIRTKFHSFLDERGLNLWS